MKTIYGNIKSPAKKQYTEEVGLTASQVFPAKSGRWVVRGSTGAFSAASGASDEALIGTIDFVGTASATAKATKTAIQIEPTVSVEMPIYEAGAVGGEVTQAEVDAAYGTICGLKVVSNVQYADIDNTTANQCVLNTLYCIKNPTFEAVSGGTALVEAVDVI